MRGSVSLVNLPGIVLCVSALHMIGSRALLPHCRHMTSTVHGTDDLLVGHLAFVRDYVLLARMARILRLLYLSSLSVGSLLRLALRVSLRRGLPNGPLGTDLTLLRRGLPRLPKLLGLLHLLWLPRRSLLFARHVALAVVLARLPGCLLLRLALAQRQLARGLLPLDLAPVLLTAKATLNPHVGVLPPVRTGVLM